MAFLAAYGDSLTATDQPQKLASPNYPSLHRSNLVCTWVIFVPDGYFVEIVVDELSDEINQLYLEVCSYVDFKEYFWTYNV